MIKKLLISTVACFVIFYLFLGVDIKTHDPIIDPFREKFFDLRDNPPTPLENKTPIPQIIHQFWIGDESLPDPYIKISETCKNLEGFEYKLWTNDNYHELLRNDAEEEIYNNIIHMGDKKDYLSFRALLKYGGVSLDTSMICIKSPKKLHENYSFYAMYPYSVNVKDNKKFQHALLLHSGILAATRNSTVIKSIIDKFEKFRVNYPYYNKKYTSFDDKNIRYGWLAQILINEAVDEHCFKEGKICSDVKIIHKERGLIPKLGLVK